jgi:hypothetical protein
MNITIDPIQAVIVITSLVAWFARLEFKTSSNEKQIDKIILNHESLENKVIEKLSIVEQSLARIEGRLQIDKEK